MKKIKGLNLLRVALRTAQETYDERRTEIVEMFENHTKIIQATVDEEYGVGLFTVSSKLTSVDTFKIFISCATKEMKNHDTFIMDIDSDGKTKISVENSDHNSSMGKLVMSMGVINKISEDIYKQFNQ